MNAAENKLATILARHSWALLLRGLVAIAYGVLAWLGSTSAVMHGLARAHDRCSNSLRE